MRLFRTIGAVGLLAAAAAVAPAVGTGHAEQPSGLCDFLNSPDRDGLYRAGFTFQLQAFAGETIIVSVGPPTSVGTPTGAQLRVNDSLVASGGFPATLFYTVPADGTYFASWALVGFANATWNVSCLPEPVCTITGTSAGDVLVGTEGADVICGLGGGDSIDGRGGNDLVLGGDGGDSIRGGSGQDGLLGEAGGDSIDGRDGAPGDVIIGGPGGDSVVGDSGDTVAQ